MSIATGNYNPFMMENHYLLKGLFTVQFILSVYLSFYFDLHDKLLTV